MLKETNSNEFVCENCQYIYNINHLNQVYNQTFNWDKPSIYVYSISKRKKVKLWVKKNGSIENKSNQYAV